MQKISLKDNKEIEDVTLGDTTKLLNEDNASPVLLDDQPIGKPEEGIRQTTTDTSINPSLSVVEMGQISFKVDPSEVGGPQEDRDAEALSVTGTMELDDDSVIEISVSKQLQKKFGPYIM